jgi:hypothetical protein
MATPASRPDHVVEVGRERDRASAFRKSERQTTPSDL